MARTLRKGMAELDAACGEAAWSAAHEQDNDRYEVRLVGCKTCPSLPARHGGRFNTTSLRQV